MGPYFKAVDLKAVDLKVVNLKTVVLTNKKMQR